MIASSVLRASLALRPPHHRVTISRRLHSRSSSTGAANASIDSHSASSSASSSGSSLKLALASVGVLGAGGAAFYCWKEGVSPSDLYSTTTLVRNVINPGMPKEPPPQVQPVNVESMVQSEPLAAQSEPAKTAEPEPAKTTEPEPAKTTEPEPAKTTEPTVGQPELVGVKSEVAVEELQPALSEPQQTTAVVDENLLEAARISKEAAALTLAKAEAARLAGIEKREAAKQELTAALDCQDLVRIQDAIKAAAEVGLGDCTELMLARSFLTPSLVLRCSSQGGSAVVHMPSELRGLTPAGAEVVEFIASEEMSAEQLQARVVELSRFLAAGRLYPKAAFAETLATPLEEAELDGLQRLEEALRQLKADCNAETEAQCAALDAQLQKQNLDTVEATRTEAIAEAEQAFAIADSSMKEAAEDTVEGAKSTFLHDVISFGTGLGEMEDALEGEAARVEGIYNYNFLSNAVAQLENAISAGRVCEQELQKLCSIAEQADSFAAGILAALPASCTALCKDGRIPTEASIKNGLHFKVGDLTAAAFLPPGGGMGAEIVARLFRHLYVLNSDADVPVDTESAPDKDVRQNLAALRRLSKASTPAELQAAFLNLEASLTGSCRERAEEELVKVRSALLLRQAIYVIKARMQCLSASEED